MLTGLVSKVKAEKGIKMLLIGLKMKESIVILDKDGNVSTRIYLLRKNGNQHVMGVEADRSIKVFRHAEYVRQERDKDEEELISWRCIDE